MIPTAQERAEFERNAELARLAAQVAQLLSEPMLKEVELQQVFELVRRELTPPAVDSVVDRARLTARGW